jgi:flagellar hook assembly protein FlgD
MIEYSLPKQSRVTIEVFNLLGERVRRLVDETKPAGVHQVSWDGTDQAGQAVSTGIYLYRFIADRHVETKKMLLMK